MLILDSGGGGTPLFGLNVRVRLNGIYFSSGSWFLNGVYNFIIYRLEQGVFLKVGDKAVYICNINIFSPKTWFHDFDYDDHDVDCIRTENEFGSWKKVSWLQ